MRHDIATSAGPAPRAGAPIRRPGLCLLPLLIWVHAVASPAAEHPPAAGPAECLVNPTFTAPATEGLPTAWQPWTPGWRPAACTLRTTPAGLEMAAPGRPFAVGGVTQDVGHVTPHRAYALRAQCRWEGLTRPRESLLLRLTWTRAARPLHPAGWLARGPLADAQGGHFEDIFVAPAEADGARVTLALKWPRGGRVVWRRVSLTPTAAPAARRVRLGTVYLRPRGTTTAENLERFCAQIDAAGARGLDLLCLGEGITLVGTGKTYADCAEPIPGPSTERLGRAARRNGLWVVAGLYERVGRTLYNTAVLLDREGKLAGTYRKVHLPREEWSQGITPGDRYPVFKTDFGTVAIQICYDWFFPEPEALFARQGAEILLAPTWGNTLPDHDGIADGETTFRVRARDNGLFLVPSVYDGNSLVIDPLGRILASSAGREGVFWAEVDLNDRPRLDWVGHWGSIGPRHRRPATYGGLSEPHDPGRP